MRLSEKVHRHIDKDLNWLVTHVTRTVYKRFASVRDDCAHENILVAFKYKIEKCKVPGKWKLNAVLVNLKRDSFESRRVCHWKNRY